MATTTMNTASASTVYTQEDYTRGCNIIAITLKVIAWTLAAAFAWSFSGFWMVLLMYIIAQLIASLAVMLAAKALDAVVPQQVIGSIGCAAGNTMNRITGLFSRK